MSWCTSGVGLQVQLFIDNRHLGSIHLFQRYSCCRGSHMEAFREVSLKLTQHLVSDKIFCKLLLTDGLTDRLTVGQTTDKV